MLWGDAVMGQNLWGDAVVGLCYGVMWLWGSIYRAVLWGDAAIGPRYGVPTDAVILPAAARGQCRYGAFP